MRITIIGAGIIGLNVAHALLDEGHQVILVDRGGRGARPTDGNAGWIAHTDILPLASAKMWRHLPRWLLDPLGPLSIRPSYLPSLAPWLTRFLLSATPQRIEHSTKAIVALNGASLPAWKRRLELLDLDDHLRERGILSVWKRRNAFDAATPLFARQRGYGIAVEILEPTDVKHIEPALQGVEAAALYPQACHVADPADLALALLKRALERGAEHIGEDAIALQAGADGVAILTDGAQSIAGDRVIIAAGIWSRVLARQLGDHIPLETERGYNATFAPGSFGVSRPVVYEGEGFVTTPLDTGDRVGGAVEFAGIEAPADHRRTDAMVQKLRHFLPHLDPDLPSKRWMGFRPSIPDSLPVIGAATRDPRIIYAFGHGHYGLTQSAATAEIVAALIAGRKADIETKPYSPQRFGRG